MVEGASGKQGPHFETARARSGGGTVAPEKNKPYVIIVDSRPLSQYCLLQAARAALVGDTVLGFANFDECLASELDLAQVSVVLFCVSRDAAARDELQLLLRQVAESPGSPPIILVSDNEDPSKILEAFEFGVRGYLPTTSPFEVAIEAVRLVKAGGAYVPASSFIAFHREAGPAKSARTASKAEGFTTRQTAVLLALREGKANKNIAYELNMRESTVKVHVRNIMRKLNARNRTEVTFKTMNLF